eukprot:c21495_g2_i1 orf=333-2150(+)
MECNTANSSVHVGAPSIEMGKQVDVEKVPFHNDDAMKTVCWNEEAVDWLGRPATSKHGGPKTTVYILANQGLWNVANYAVATNLVLYFKKVLQMSNATAANSTTNWFGTMWMLALFGGFMGDSYFGRFWTCFVFQLVHILGLVVLSLSVTIDALKPAECLLNCPKPSTLQTSIFFVAIYIIAFGSGGYLPAFQALGADQFESDIHKTTFFGWLFFFTNVGSILANTLFVWMENQGKWALAYWLATIVGVLAFLIFALGTPTYRQFRPAGNPFTRIAQVLVASLRKRRLEVPKDCSLLHEIDEKELVRQGSRKMPHTTRFRFLDKAATKEQKTALNLKNSKEGGENGVVNGWKLCNVTQVEEAKQLWRMFPIFLTAIPFSAIFSQVNTLFVEQAAVMETKIGGFRIPPASMTVLSTASIFLFTILYPVTVVPLARAITGKHEGLSQLQRMAVGEIIAALSMAGAAILERKRLHLATTGHQLSIMWQCPQQVLMGAAMVFLAVGAMDFFYTEAPHSMRGMVSSLSLVNLAIGSYVSSALISLTVQITTKGGQPGWIPPDLNEGHLDYFYWLLFLLSILTTATFLVCSWWFHHSSSPNKTTTPTPLAN